jgi:hypothetical protein
MGKADILQEETVKCTVEATGVWVPASIERLAEITTGKAYFQLVMATISKDPVNRGQPNKSGGFRTGA